MLPACPKLTLWQMLRYKREKVLRSAALLKAQQHHLHHAKQSSCYLQIFQLVFIALLVHPGKIQVLSRKSDFMSGC